VKSKVARLNFLLDSGAFSVWKGGGEVDLQAYTDFALAHQAWIEACVGLDKIDPANPEGAASESWAAFSYMRKRGLEPIPVVHAGEKLEWIDRYLDAGCEYVGLGTSALRHDRPGDASQRFYEAAWKHITKYAGIRVHAFGEGREHILKDYPFYSADSTGWINGAQKYGEATWWQDHKRDPHSEALRAAAVHPDYRIRSLLRTFISCQDALEMEQRVRKARPEFRFHLVLDDNVSARAAFAYAGAENGLVSYYYIERPEVAADLRAFALDPMAACQSDPRLAEYIETLRSACR
jgi:hypothetical protein